MQTGSQSWDCVCFDGGYSMKNQGSSPAKSGNNSRLLQWLSQAEEKSWFSLMYILLDLITLFGFMWKRVEMVRKTMRNNWAASRLVPWQPCDWNACRSVGPRESQGRQDSDRNRQGAWQGPWIHRKEWERVNERWRTGCCSRRRACSSATKGVALLSLVYR